MSYYSYPVAGMVGDPGFFGAIGRVFKGAGKLLGIGGGGVSKKDIGGIVTGAINKVLMPAGRPGMGLPAGGGMIKLPKIKLPKGAGTVLAGAAGVGAGVLIDQFGRPVRRRGRRLNVTNVKALRRSIRRCAGFAKLAKKVLRFTSPKPPRGRAYFRPKRRKARV